MRKLVFVCAAILLITACVSSDSSDQLQGIIEYDVTYLSNQSSIPTNVLPKKITLKFKQNKSITTIEGFMNMFSLSNISDFRKQTNTMILKVLDSKFVHYGEKHEPPFFFDNLGELNIVLTNETKIIAGLNCKKALVQPKNKEINAFDIYFTEDIKLNKPNKSTPFNSIDGVLVQFNIKLNNVEMQLCASKYKKEYFSSDVFDVPDACKKVSREKIAKILSKLLE